MTLARVGLKRASFMVKLPSWSHKPILMVRRLKKWESKEVRQERYMKYQYIQAIQLDSQEKGNRNGRTDSFDDFKEDPNLINFAHDIFILMSVGLQE